MITMIEIVYVVIEQTSRKFIKYSGQMDIDNVTTKLSQARTYDTQQQAQKAADNVNGHVNDLVKFEQRGQWISPEKIQRHFIIKPVELKMN